MFGGRVVQYRLSWERVAIGNGLKEHFDDLEQAVELHIADCFGWVEGGTLRGRQGAFRRGGRARLVVGALYPVPIAGAAVGNEAEDVELREEDMGWV